MREAPRFLVVEDHPFQRTLLEQTLRGLGHGSVVGAGDGAEAVRLLRTMTFDIVISDLMMPGLDGIELLPLLRSSAPDVSLILCSADQSSLEIAALIASAQGIKLLGSIGKPVTAARLRPLLDAYLSNAAP